MDDGTSYSGSARRTPNRVWHPALCLALLLVPASVRAQSTRFSFRTGVVVSTALAEDRVANPALSAGLGGGVGSVQAIPAPAFQIEIAGARTMRPRTLLELAAGWTAAGIDARDDAGTRHMQDAGVGHATVSVRYLATPALDAGCGFGMIRYFADSEGLFASGSEVSPLLECASRLTVMQRAGRRFVIRVAGQMHRFRTPVLADAGAQAGSVFRLAVQAGLELGGER